MKIHLVVLFFHKYNIFFLWEYQTNHTYFSPVNIISNTCRLLACPAAASAFRKYCYLLALASAWPAGHTSAAGYGGWDCLICRLRFPCSFSGLARTLLRPWILRESCNNLCSLNLPYAFNLVSFIYKLCVLLGGYWVPGEEVIRIKIPLERWS